MTEQNRSVVPADLLIGSLRCVYAVGFTLRELANGDSSPGRVLHLQHGWTRRAELSEATLEVFIQVAIKNWVEAAAGSKRGGEASVCACVCMVAAEYAFPMSPFGPVLTSECE